ncbi:hypothetical protein [Glycomyces arizonensis]|uniref:hypothetical protein n=1 Tax=Glycomyces arizonensis TaxID=256035 RepID=UPI0004005688|nr:hypothetical protein [Glycomyces arizonensis]
MAYTAPDPAQFDKMEMAYSYLAPSAAVNITLPTLLFKGPCIKVSKIIYLHQCNPGKIMKGGAQWLLLAQKYSEARDMIEEKVNRIAPEAWEGKDRDAFDEKVQNILGQLETIQAFAMHIGISLMTIASMLAVMIPVMLTYATMLMGLTIPYMWFRMQPPPLGTIMARSYHVMALGMATSAYATLKAMEAMHTAVARALAAFIGANMTVSWVDMATKGNIINPANTIGGTVFNLMDGLANLAITRALAPGGAATKSLGPGVAAGLAGGVGAQGVYNLGTEGAAQTGLPNEMTDEGVNAGTYDFVPDAAGEELSKGDQPPAWTPGGSSGTEENTDSGGKL